MPAKMYQSISKLVDDAITNDNNMLVEDFNFF